MKLVFSVALGSSLQNSDSLIVYQEYLNKVGPSYLIATKSDDIWEVDFQDDEGTVLGFETAEEAVGGIIQYMVKLEFERTKDR